MRPETTHAFALPRPGTIVCVLIGTILMLAPGSPAGERGERPGSGPGAQSELATEKPNILLVVSDDQPLRSMETMPLTRRWMNRSGVKYTHAYATTPVCCPSRATLLTGQYAHNHRVTTNGRETVLRLDQESTVQKVLSDNGYLTAAYGKYLNAWNVYKPPPHFDEWAIIPKSKDAYSWGIWNVQGGLEYVPTYGTTFVGEKATDFIERAHESDQPWFMYLAPPAPHSPYEPEGKYRSLEVSRWKGDPSNFDRDDRDMPDYVRAAQRKFYEGQDVRRRQLITLKSLDDTMGGLQATLEGLGELDNTLVIYISDNGYLWGQHHMIKKFVPYVESVRIPAFISWPEGLVPGKDERVVGTIDITPTILDAAGFDPRQELPVDGRSLLDGSWSRREILIEAWKESARIPAWSGLISPRKSYVTYYSENDFTPTFHEYYKLLDDPYQMTNLLGDDSSLNDPVNRRELELRLFRARTCAGPDDCP